MMKFFRKHMKELLAVFMALLLVVWLGGSALTDALRGNYDPGDMKKGVIYGQPVVLNDMRPVFSEANILSSLGVRCKIPWIYPLLAQGVSDPRMLGRIAAQVREEELNDNEWYMLNAEADRLGVYVSQEAVERFKMAFGVSGAAIDAVRQRNNISLADVNHAIQTFVRVLETLDLARSGIKASEADIQDFVRQTDEKARVQVVLFENSKFIDKAYEPTEAEMKELFEKGKDKDPGFGSSEPGYRKPEMVQTEYIRVSAEALEAVQKVSDEEAYAYWTAHKTEFLRPATPPATQPAASQPVPPKPEPYETFTEAKPEVIARIKTEQARQEALRLARDMIGRLNRPWANAPTSQPGGYKEIPAEQMANDVYPKLIESMEQRYPGVLKYARSALEDNREVSANPEIGRAMAFAGTQQPIPFVQVAFTVAGLEADRETSSDLARLFRNVYETCAEPLVDRDGNAYVFRTVTTRAKQAPASWEEVREKLAADIRQNKADERVGELARDLAEQAKKVGLKAAFEANSALKTKLGDAALKTPEPFARKRFSPYQGELYPNWVPGVGSDPELVELCFKLAGEKDLADRVAVHDIENLPRWAVVEGLEVLPVTEDEYEAQRQMAVAVTTMKREMDFLTNWFGAEQLRARVGWEDPAPEKAADEAAEEGSEEAPEVPADTES